MADTICHSVQGGLIIAAPLLSRIKRKPRLWYAVAAGTVLGALPDLVGAYGNLVERDHWGEYRVAHFGWIAQVLQYVPMYWLHLYVDSFTHGKGHRWWKWDERMYVEILLWVVNVLVIAWMVRRWRRMNKQMT